MSLPPSARPLRLRQPAPTTGDGCNNLAGALLAVAAAAVLSGVPSTIHALAASGDALGGVRAAGTLWPGRRDRPGLLRGVAAHVVISAAWGTVLAAGLRPLARRSRPTAVVAGAVAGLGIAAVDLGVVAPRRYPHVAALPLLPQLADHVAFGSVVGALVPAGGRPPPNVRG